MTESGSYKEIFWGQWDIRTAQTVNKHQVEKLHRALKVCSFKRNIYGTKYWLEDLDPGKGGRWPKWTLLPKGYQWQMKGRQASTQEQDRVLHLMGARCPGISTQKHLENKRQEKEAGLQKLPWKLQGKVISILSSSIWPAAHTELTPACGPRPAFRFLLLQSPRAPLRPYQNPGVTPWVTETTYMGQATASALSSLALFTSSWKNGHPQGSIKDYAAHHSSSLE